MKKLIVDATPLFFQGGISNYVASFVGQLVHDAVLRWRVHLVYRLGISRNRLQAYRQHCDRLTEHVAAHWIFLPDRVTKFLWERGEVIPFLGEKGRENIFIATTEFVPKRRKGLTAWIVYDLTPYYLAELSSIDPAAYIDAMRQKADRADFVIAISENTKKDVIHLLNYSEDRICVVYPGNRSLSFHSPVQPVNPYSRRPYIYYLGALALNKNVDGMLRIFSRVVNFHHIDVDIILTGKDFYGKPFWEKMIQKLKIEGRVHFTGRVSDDDRDRLVQGALMLWQFSWYEGFSLPVLEAAGCGVPVMHSNRGAMPEILRNPEQAIDPADENDAAARAAAALSSPETLERWKKHGLVRAEEFSWEKSVGLFLEWLEQKF